MEIGQNHKTYDINSKYDISPSTIQGKVQQSGHYLAFVEVCGLFNNFSPSFIVKFSHLGPYVSVNKFKIILLLLFSSLFCLINSHFLITKCHVLYVLCKEKLSVDN